MAESTSKIVPSQRPLFLCFHARQRFPVSHPHSDHRSHLCDVIFHHVVADTLPLRVDEQDPRRLALLGLSSMDFSRIENGHQLRMHRRHPLRCHVFGFESSTPSGRDLALASPAQLGVGPVYRNSRLYVAPKEQTEGSGLGSKQTRRVEHLLQVIGQVSASTAGTIKERLCQPVR